MTGKCLLCETVLKAKDREELDELFTKHNDIRHRRERIREEALIMEVKE